MAAKTSLVATFLNATGATETISWANFDPESPSSDIKSFINSVVSNSAALLKTALTSCTQAIVRTTTDTRVDLS